jgi:hypothetical protein
MSGNPPPHVPSWSISTVEVAGSKLNTYELLIAFACGAKSNVATSCGVADAGTGAPDVDPEPKSPVAGLLIGMGTGSVTTFENP